MDRSERFWNYAEQLDLQDLFQFIYGDVEGERGFQRLREEFATRRKHSASALAGLLTEADQAATDEFPADTHQAEQRANEIVLQQIVSQLHQRLKVLDFMMTTQIKNYLTNSLRDLYTNESKLLPRHGFEPSHFLGVLAEEILSGALDFHGLCTSAQRATDWLRTSGDMLQDRDIKSDEKQTTLRLMSLLSRRMRWRVNDQIRKLRTAPVPETDLVHDGDSRLDQLESVSEITRQWIDNHDTLDELNYFVKQIRSGTQEEANILVILLNSQSDSSGRQGTTRWLDVFSTPEVREYLQQDTIPGLPAKIVDAGHPNGLRAFKAHFTSLMNEFRSWHERRTQANL